MNPPPTGSVRVVIDTNVVLPVLTGNQPERNWLRALWTIGRIVPLVNAETIAELTEKILERSPSPKDYQADLFVRKTLLPYRQRWEDIPVTNIQAPICRDKDDQKFIDLAITGRADCLVTRDRALLEMGDELPFWVLDDYTFRGMMET